jgi:hypothetical protein
MPTLIMFGVASGNEQRSQKTERTTSEREQSNNVGFTHDEILSIKVGFAVLFGFAVGFGIGWWITMPNVKAVYPSCPGHATIELSRSGPRAWRIHCS